MNRVLVLLAGTALAGCGHAFYGTTTVSSTADPNVVYDCVRSWLPKAEFRQTAHDDKDRRLAAERVVPDARVSSILFRKQLDLLEVSIRPDNSGNTGIEIKSHTMNEFGDAGGVRREEIPANPSVAAAADSLIKACGS